MIIAGLDLSLRGTGICILGQGLLRTFRVGVSIDRSNKALDIERELIERLITISNEIQNRMQEFRVDEVGIENYAFGAFGAKGKSASGTGLGELAGVVKKDLWTNLGLVPRVYGPTTVRSVVFGKGAGKMKKVQVVTKLKELGLDFPSDDEADAFMVAACRYIGFYDDSLFGSVEFWKERLWVGGKK